MYAHKLAEPQSVESGVKLRLVADGDPASGPHGPAITRLVEALQPASVAWIVRVPAGCSMTRGQHEIEAAVEAALQETLLEPCNVGVIGFGCEVVAAVLTPRGGQSLDPMQVHVLLALFRTELCALLDLDADQAAETLTVVPIAPVAPVDKLQENISALNELLETLIHRQLNVQFQPIVHFSEQRVYGYESLIRVPQDGSLKRPGQYFNEADRARLVSWLNVACQQQCFQGAAKAAVKEYLFINMDAEGLAHLHMAERSLAASAAEHNIRPDRVVLEITERQTVDDFPRLTHYIEEMRAQGFKLAIDDAGAGYSSLRAIAELRPEFVKIDRSLVRTIHNNGTRRALLSTLVRYAEQIGAAVIAEGMETRDELAAVIDMGVRYGQGYLLGKPNDSFKGLRREMCEFLAEQLERRKARTLGGSYSIEAIARCGVTVAPETPCEEVARRFARAPDLESIVVVDGDRIAGLVMRDRFEASYDGASIGPAIDVLMDRRPFVVEAGSRLEEVAEQATFRREMRFHDDILIGRAGAYIGHLPVRALLEAMTRLQVSRGKYSHGVTGLPGTPVLESTLADRIAAHVPTAVVRVDVSGFRAFNTQYGLEMGDEALRSAARLLQASAEGLSQGGEAPLVAHAHGSRFVALIAPQCAEAVCADAAAAFETLASQFYRPEHRQAGRLEYADTTGRVRAAPLMRLAAVGISTEQHAIGGYHDAMRIIDKAVAERTAADRRAPFWMA